MTSRQACRASGIGAISISEHEGSSRLHRAVPALSARLVVSLNGPIEVRYGTNVEQALGFVAGLMRKGVTSPTITLCSEQPIAYVELSPSALRRLTGVPISEVDAGGVSADAVLPWANSLSEELAGHPIGHREAVMRDRLLERVSRADHHPGSEDALRALDLIRATGGGASVEDLASHVHLSTRRLRAVMLDALGTTPKFASRVARLGRAVSRAGMGAMSWAEVATESGYHDQSHLVRDFRSLMGTTPTEWLDEEGRNLQGWQRPAQ